MEMRIDRMYGMYGKAEKGKKSESERKSFDQV